MTGLELLDEVNRTGKELYTEFIPTRDELLVLVKYWYEHCFVDEYFTFLTGHVFCDGRGRTYALPRIGRVEKVLGIDDVRQAKSEAEEYCRKKYKIDPVMWRIFKDGDSAQWEMIQRQFGSELQKARAEVRN